LVSSSGGSIACTSSRRKRAHATSGDIKQLVELFGLSITGAMPYVNAVSHANANRHNET
jgi:hypothetical protein